MDLCLIKKAIIYTTFFKKLLCMCDFFCTFALLFEKAEIFFVGIKPAKDVVCCYGLTMYRFAFWALSVFFFAFFESSSKNL